MSDARASKKQQELLTFVDGFIKGNGYGPSYREIMRALGYKSVSTVAIHIDGLIAKGYLHRRDNSARSLEVVTMRDNAHHAATQDFDAELLKRIRAANLGEEDTRAVKKAAELLGLTEVVEKMGESTTEKTPDK